MIIDEASWRAEPWKNGRGITRVIYRDADLRISLAEVTESGAFSTFPGLVRWTTLVAGDGISLGGRTLVRGAPIELDGAQPLDAIVAVGPVTLLNIFAPPGVIDVGAGSALADFAFEIANRRALHFAPPERVGGDVVWIRYRFATSNPPLVRPTS